MLLRRITEHVKTQNWTAIGLDFFIVVVGVFVGLQVSNWNDARQAHAAEREALLRLQQESEQVVAYWDSQVEMWRSQNANRRIFLEALTAGAMNVNQKPAVDDAIMRLSHFPHFNPPSTVYDELIGAGGLSQVSDLDARNAVSKYVAEVNFVNGQLAQFRTNLPKLYEAYSGRIFNVFASDEKSLRRFEYDIAALSADRGFVSEIVGAVRNQLQFQSYREGALGEAIAMCTAVSKAVSMTCDPPEISPEAILRRDGVNQ